MSVKALKTQLMAAVAMVIVAAVALSSSTYAWFAVNTAVEATGMNVNAKAETGLVITNADKGSYGASATAKDSAAKALFPGSTANGIDWYHSTSNDPGVANTSLDYTKGVENTNYVKHEFYIRSSAADTMNVTSLDVTKVAVASSSQELSKALRVGVVFDGDTNLYTYAPVTGYTSSYEVKTATATQTITPKDSDAKTPSAVTSIPGNTLDGVKVTVYIWFEGEDASCISNNLVSSLENLAVTVTFGTTVAP